MKVLVWGGRDFQDKARVFATLDGLDPALVIHGGARGADSLAEKWAATRQVPCHVYPADWRRHGRAAGPIRNREMLEQSKPDLVVAFPGGRGTAHMVRIARDAGYRVIEAEAEGKAL